jgi:S-adenosylmethionine:tRNA ribosyltransferase-isomerase
MHPKKLLIKDFTYNLPEAFIAKYPLQNRDKSKLLICENDMIKEDIYFNLDKYLPENTLLIFNNTKVVEARLLFEKNTGSTIELFCLEPGEKYVDITSAMLQKEKVLWKCLVGGAKKWKEDVLKKIIKNDAHEIELYARKIKKRQDHFLIEFSWNVDGISFAEILHLAGAIPLPPYLNREAEEKDKETYQTIYAKHDGSVAAPTAGLHFTERLFEKLEAKKIEKDFVTLHVGAGTFKPVKSEKISEHAMHAEFFEVKKELLENLIKNIDGNIVAVGTTSLRTIESLYWMGVKIEEWKMLNRELSKNAESFTVHQWDAYELPQNISPKIALKNLLQWMNENKRETIIAKTQILIAPDYKLKIAKGIVTNFHQPQSTLLLLVAAIAGKNWKKIYEYALENNFRFLSYGDGCLIWKKE